MPFVRLTLVNGTNTPVDAVLHLYQATPAPGKEVWTVTAYAPPGQTVTVPHNLASISQVLTPTGMDNVREHGSPITTLNQANNVTANHPVEEVESATVSIGPGTNQVSVDILDTNTQMKRTVTSPLA